MFIKITSHVWLWAYGFTVLILFFLNLSINISNSTINANERTMNYNDGQINQTFIAKLTGSQEIPFVNTDAMGTALFKENLLKNGTLEYGLVLNDIKEITRIYIDFNNTIPLKEIYSNPIIPGLCCLLSEASKPENFYLYGTVENDINTTPLDLIKNGIPLQVNDDTFGNIFYNNKSIIETMTSTNKSKNLIGLFESELVFITVETKFHPTGEIRGQIVDKVQILE